MPDGQLPGLNAITIDVVIGVAGFIIIMLIVEYVKRFENVWVNRKLIHLSSVPAVLAYIYLFYEPYVFTFFSILFTVLLSVKHLRKDLSTWFQIEGNYGEIYYTLMYGVLGISMWWVDKVLGGLIMLFMAVGDSITGIVRSRFVRSRQKHWTGSAAMLITCVIIGYILYGYKGVVLGVLATLAEAQPYIDDNLAVPAVTAPIGYILISTPLQI